jgi:hypothetical protein
MGRVNALVVAKICKVGRSAKGGVFELAMRRMDGCHAPGIDPVCVEHPRASTRTQCRSTTVAIGKQGRQVT